MLSIYSQRAFLLAVTGLVCFSMMSWGQAPPAKEPATAQLAAQVPAPAVTEVAEGQAIVTYESEQLMIKAQNAPLIEVLRAVCTQIGAELDAQSEPDEPILGAFGPGRAHDVLAAMMGRSHFNLAMAGSPGDPNALVRIVILPNSADSADKTNNGSEAPPAQDSVAQDQATEQQDRQAAEEPVASMPTASDVQSRISQVREVFAQVRTEFSQLTEATDLDLDTVLKEAEAQAKAAAAADPNTPPPIAVATNHPRGRSRHTH
jgi:hypothetical protein